MTDWEDLKKDPLSDTDLQKTRLTIQRMDDAWPIIGPIVAVVRNWKAWAIALAFFLWINQPDILGALKTIMGVKGP